MDGIDLILDIPCFLNTGDTKTELRTELRSWRSLKIMNTGT